jgi:hypothetical protein
MWESVPWAESYSCAAHELQAPRFGRGTVVLRGQQVTPCPPWHREWTHTMEGAPGLATAQGRIAWTPLVNTSSSKHCAHSPLRTPAALVLLTCYTVAAGAVLARVFPVSFALLCARYVIARHPHTTEHGHQPHPADLLVLMTAVTIAEEMHITFAITHATSCVRPSMPYSAVWATKEVTRGCGQRCCAGSQAAPCRHNTIVVWVS